LQLRVKRTAIFFATGLALLNACSPSDPEGACPDEPPPAFSITVRAESGPLPADTVLTLYYGAGVEVFELARPGPEHVLFCTPKPSTNSLGGGGAAGAAGEGGAPADSTTDELACDVWIEGSATISVTGGAYPSLSQELKGEVTDCGQVTVEEELVLGEVTTDSSGE